MNESSRKFIEAEISDRGKDGVKQENRELPVPEPAPKVPAEHAEGKHAESIEIPAAPQAPIEDKKVSLEPSMHDDFGATVERFTKASLKTSFKDNSEAREAQGLLDEIFARKTKLDE